MLSRELFKEKFIDLATLFNVSKPVDKAKLYYEVLSKYSDQAFLRAYDDIKLNKEKLPTIKGFLELVRAGEPSKAYIRCDHCNGKGQVTIGLEVYRARCEHGDALNSHIAQAPESTEIALYNQRREYDHLYGEGYFDRMLEKRYPKLT